MKIFQYFKPGVRWDTSRKYKHRPWLIWLVRFLRI